MLLQSRWWLRAALVALFCLWLSVTTTQSQEEAAETEAESTAPAAAEDAASADENADADTPTAEDNAESAPEAEEGAADATSEASDSAIGAFNAKLAEWKSLLKEMRELKQTYEQSTEDNPVELIASWDKLLVRGEAMINELRTAGIAAYTESRGQDRQMERFLIKLLEDDSKRSACEEAAALSQALLENGCENADVFGVGGIVSFATMDLDLAEKYLREAQTRGSIDQTGRDFLGLLDEYRGYWTEEQEIRQREAEADDLPRIRITTNKGVMVAELFENEAPETVGNFISLVESGFYDGLTFHRVLEGFMAQGGCPRGDGTGGPGYEIYCECAQDNYRKHFRGTLSMAHSGQDTGGSQFFITFVPTAHLNAKHTAFGRITEGIDVLAKIQRIDPEQPDNALPDKMVKVEVIRKRDHEYKPNKVQ